MSIENGDGPRHPDDNNNDRDKKLTRLELDQKFIKQTAVDQNSSQYPEKDQNLIDEENDFLNWLVSQGYSREQATALPFEKTFYLLKRYQIEKNAIASTENNPHSDNQEPSKSNPIKFATTKQEPSPRKNVINMADYKKQRAPELDESFIPIANRPKYKESLDRTHSLEKNIFYGKKIDWDEPVKPPTFSDRLRDAFIAGLEYYGAIDPLESDKKENKPFIRHHDNPDSEK